MAFGGVVDAVPSRRCAPYLRSASDQSDVSRRGHPQSSHQAGHFVWQNITEKVSRDDDIKLPWIEDQLHSTGIDHPVVHLHATLVIFTYLSSGL
jgi:hypothetical protein